MNIIRTIVSKLLMHETNVSRTISQNQDSKEPVTVDLDILAKHFAKTIAWQEDTDKFLESRCTIDVFYEDFHRDPYMVDKKILRFMDLRLCSLESDLVKQNPEPLPMLVSNFEELHNFAAQRNCEWMLSE